MAAALTLGSRSPGPHREIFAGFLLVTEMVISLKIIHPLIQ